MAGAPPSPPPPSPVPGVRGAPWLPLPARACAAAVVGPAGAAGARSSCAPGDGDVTRGGRKGTARPASGPGGSRKWVGLTPEAPPGPHLRSASRLLARLHPQPTPPHRNRGNERPCTPRADEDVHPAGGRAAGPGQTRTPGAGAGSECTPGGIGPRAKGSALSPPPSSDAPSRPCLPPRLWAASRRPGLSPDPGWSAASPPGRAISRRFLSYVHPEVAGFSDTRGPKGTSTLACCSSFLSGIRCLQSSRHWLGIRK